MDKTKFYNGADLLNANCTINFSVGNRSAGKSYYWKRYCIRRFLKNDEQFIYLRRNQNDIDLTIKNFFDDISHEFVGYGFEVEGNRLYLTQGDGKEKERFHCGYAFALSILQKVKSMPMEKVNTIFFDEFIPENLQYLKPSEPSYEPNQLTSLFMTVARGREKPIREDVKIICVANAISLYNPYFSTYGIDLAEKTKFKDKHKSVYAEKITNTAVADEIRKSKVGGFLTCTSYGAYALENISFKDIYTHIERKPIKSVRRFCLYMNGWYTCYTANHRMYFEKSFDKTIPQKYKITELNQNDPWSKVNIPYFKGQIFKVVQDYANADTIYYDTMQTKTVLAGFMLPKIAK